jgi:HD-GYP domain-containing protein (c-di-GMP phosphodiesterase class II)
VDFRSPLNARHSSGVAASAAALARLCGFSEHECLMMRMAGYLHDIGKLAVSAAILEKNGPLDTNEISIIKSHPYYTYNILAIVEDFNTINLWASLHHERLDGRGYPFRIRAGNMPLGSQIVGLADVYTALNEERPYRTAMSRRDSMKVMAKMVNDGAINGDLLKILDANFDEINEQRINIQTESAEEYRMLNPIFAARYAKK